MADVLPTTVSKCARCGRDHLGLVYAAFDRPVQCDGNEFTHWATCPVTGAPILMRFTQPAVG